jgi:ubiquitin-protein ligase
MMQPTMMQPQPQPQISYSRINKEYQQFIKDVHNKNGVITDNNNEILDIAKYFEIDLSAKYETLNIFLRKLDVVGLYELQINHNPKKQSFARTTLENKIHIPELLDIIESYSTNTINISFNINCGFIGYPLTPPIIEINNLFCDNNATKEKLNNICKNICLGEWNPSLMLRTLVLMIIVEYMKIIE